MPSWLKMALIAVAQATFRSVSLPWRLSRIGRVIDFAKSEWVLSDVRRRGTGCEAGRGTIISNGNHIRMGTGVWIGPYSRIDTIPQYRGTTFAPELVIEDGVSMGWFTHLACAQSVRIGRDTLIAGSCFISDHNHGFAAPDTFGISPKWTPLEVAPVSIGQRCWIGERVCILPGVTIGDDCLVGAATVVTRSIPDGCMAIGSPARVIKRRDASGRWVPVVQDRKES